VSFEVTFEGVKWCWSSVCPWRWWITTT